MNENDAMVNDTLFKDAQYINCVKKKIMSHALSITLGFSFVGITYPAPRSLNSTFITSALLGCGANMANTWRKLYNV